MTAAIGAALSRAPASLDPVAAEAATPPGTLTPSRLTKPVLSLVGVTLSFGGLTALSEVNLEVPAGEIRAIIGPNGAGKSSLINVISGIYRADSGLVRISDRSFRHVPTKRLARLGVARTFQNLALFPGLSVFDNVAAGRVGARRAIWIEQVLGVGRARRERDETRDRTDRMLRFLHLDKLRERSVATLPFGLQKRVELGRALVAEPRLLLLDEPMAGMTANEKGEMAAFVRAARDQHGTTVVLIEHDVGVVMNLSDQVAVLDYGRKIADGTPDAVQADQRVIDAYLGIAHPDSEAA